MFISSLILVEKCTTQRLTRRFLISLSFHTEISDITNDNVRPDKIGTKMCSQKLVQYSNMPFEFKRNFYRP